MAITEKVINSTRGALHVESGNTFRRTRATMEMVLLAFQKLIEGIPQEGRNENPAITNAKRVMELLGHPI